jgi:hypothetical protein
MRMKDKVLQIVADVDGKLLADGAIIKRVTLKPGEGWRGYFAGQLVARMSGNVWRVVSP